MRKYIKLYFNVYLKNITQLYSYGFRPDQKFIELYKNGCNIIKIIYPKLNLQIQKMLN
jgi:hypothetical protein